MHADADLLAYDALAAHPRSGKIAAVADVVIATMCDTKMIIPDRAQAAQVASDIRLSHDESATQFGNVLDVLTRGPENDGERSLARAIAALWAASRARDSAPGDELARRALWLGAHTPFDATGLIDRALGSAAAAMWAAIAASVGKAAAGSLPSMSRGETLVGASALAASKAPEAAERATELAEMVIDRQLCQVLRARPGAADGGHEALSAAGEMAARPRGNLMAALLGVTGISLAMHAIRLACRLVLGYRRPAEVALLEDGGVRIRWRTELLGRTLRDREVLIPKHALARASREVRYPGLGLYAGLLALALGSYIGMTAVVDGLRAASPSLWVTGTGVVALGLAADFVLSSFWPGNQGWCRVLLTPRVGSPLCIGGINIASANALLARLGAPSRSAIGHGIVDEPFPEHGGESPG